MDAPREYLLIFDWWDNHLFDQHLGYVRAFFSALTSLIWLPAPNDDHIAWVATIEIKRHCPYATLEFTGGLVRSLKAYQSKARNELNLPQCHALTTRYEIHDRVVSIHVTDHFHDLRET